MSCICLGCGVDQPCDDSLELRYREQSLEGQGTDPRIVHFIDMPFEGDEGCDCQANEGGQQTDDNRHLNI
jgi:hypothetical protein